MMSMIYNILPADVCLMSFDFKARLFDEDYSIKLIYNGTEHFFNTVKGDIFHNGKRYCNSSYHYLEKDSTFSKLLDAVKAILEGERK